MALPMPEPTVARKPLKSFKVLTFDIYGTLIDWEGSIVDTMQPLTDRLPAGHPLKDPHKLGGVFNDVEKDIQKAQPTLRYDRLLSEGYVRIAKERMGLTDVSDDKLKKEGDAFGASIAKWTPFPDTIDAMKRLKKHFRLVPLSNVDRASFAKTCAGPLKGVEFDAIYVAEDIGSYKPDLSNFHYLIDHLNKDFGIKKDEILHTAQSLFHDHRPAKTMGMSSAWIARKQGNASMGGEAKSIIESGEVGFGWRFGSLGEMADAVEREA